MFRIVFAIVLALSSFLQVNIHDERLSSTTWYLSYMVVPQAIDPTQFRIRFDYQTSVEPMIFGKMACNGLFAKFASPITDSLNITDWSSTTRACLPESDGDREYQFSTRMKQTATYKIEADSGHQTLTFYDASKFVMLRFITLNRVYLPVVTR